METPANQLLLGQNYFITRAKLEEAVEALTVLCNQASADPARAAMLRSLVANLKEPYLFMVAGEVNSGKSTLLNALFGEDFCSTDVIPSTDRIAYFKHGVEAHEFDFSDDILEVYRPNPFLQDFNLVDTPGTNSITPKHESITEHFLPAADLVLFVFSVTNPWGETTWNFLDRIHNQWRKKIVFILQQCDLRTEEEVAAILDHLQKTAEHRFGQQFPTFAISAKQAFHAKVSGLGAETLGKYSEIDDLERHISSVVESSETRLTKLIHAWRASCFVLSEVRSSMGAAEEIIKADNELLSELEPAANIQINRTMKKCEPIFDALDKSFMAAGLKAEPLIDGQFRLLAALVPSEKSANEVEGYLYAATMKAVRHHVGTGVDTIEADLQEIYSRVAEEMETEFKLSLTTGDEGRPDWSHSRLLVTELVESTTAELLNSIDLKQELTKRFRRRGRIIWSLIIFSMLVAAGGVAMTFLHQIPLNALMFAGSGLLFGVAAVVAYKSIKGIRVFYSSVLEEKRVQLADVQRQAFAIGTKQFFDDFITFFAPLRTVCREHREMYQPQIDQAKVCEKHLAHLESILKPVAKMLDARKK